MKQWEYKIAGNHEQGNLSLIQFLNKLGLEGWELVNVIWNEEIWFYFKREITATTNEEKQIREPRMEFKSGAAQMEYLERESFKSFNGNKDETK